MILKAPLFTPIAPMLTDCGIISLDAHAILARVRLQSKPLLLKTPLRTLLLPSTIPFHSNSWFWTRRSRSLIRFVHPNMSLFHFNIPISTNGLFHNPISTHSSITSSNINRSIPNTPFINTSITSTPTTIPLPQPSPRSDTSAPSTHRTYIPSLGQVQIGLQLCAGEPRVKCKNFALAGPQYCQAIGVSSSSHWPAVVAYGTILGHSRQVSYTLPQQTPTSWAVPSRCILCHAHLDCKPMAHLVVDCTHPTVFFARVDTQLLQSINDTRVQFLIAHCTPPPPLPPHHYHTS
ncbi:hypothetical protein BASA62_007434 [Batrachochytrium salamandrivorans]|nr:hypothetical protein BASA62_007434 [Batrachochytrium salamandrivorans]